MKTHAGTNCAFGAFSNDLETLMVLLPIVWMLDLDLIKKGHSKSSYNSKKA